MSVSGFVDVHAHVVPSGDDGARTIEEGAALCALAAEAGTSILFATPHMHAPWDAYPWSERRRELYDGSFAAVRAAAARLGVDLRRGREVFPSEVLDGPVGELRLEGTEAVLVELPGSWLDLAGQLELTARACRRIESEGLTPVLAHPERCSEVVAGPGVLEPFVARGWVLCVNASSLTGGHGRTPERVGWELVDAGLVGLVASDGHRVARPPTLDDAWHAVVARLGEATARPLFDGSALPWGEAPAARVA